MGALRSRPRLLALLLAILAVAGGLRAMQAAAPNQARQSADEVAYVGLALGLAERGTFGARDPGRLRWPPLTPVLFAGAAKIGGTAQFRPTAVAPGQGRAQLRTDIPAAYWIQALLSTLTVLAVFALAAQIAGARVGVVAAAVAAVYPPLVTSVGELLSETLGAFLLTTTLALAAAATRRRSVVFAAAAGAVLGLTVLTRADYLLLAPALALLVGVVAWKTTGARRGAAGGAALLAAFALTLAPWTAYASSKVGSFVPVTTGGGAALWVGTYLPGGGTTGGAKRALADEIRAKTDSAELRAAPVSEIPGSAVLETVAARRPDLDGEAALRAEARDNLAEQLRSPGAALSMAAGKVERMWWQPSRLGTSGEPSAVVTWAHRALVLLALIGLLGGLARRRGRSAGLVLAGLVLAYATALHAVLVSQARYNLPLMPVAIAAGIGGLALAIGGRASRGELAGRPAPTSGPAPDA